MVKEITKTLLVMLGATPVAAQSGVQQVHVGWGIDTTTTPVNEIVRSVSAYLLARGMDGMHQRRSPHWRASDQQERAEYDLTVPWIPRRATATIAAVQPIGAEWEVVTFYGVTQNGQYQPLAVQRLYATTQDDRWVLYGAIDRNTNGWATDTVGSIIYRYPPQWRFDHERAHTAATFVDSLSTALGVPSSPMITYYLWPVPGEVHRLVGLDWVYARAGARTFAADRTIVTSDTAQAEAHLHELVHAVAAPLREDGLRHAMIEEGLPVWLGGSVGRDYAEVLDELVTYQQDNRDLQFSELISTRRFTGPVTLYATGALLFDRVEARLGAAGVKQLLTAPADPLRLQKLIAGLLGLPEGQLNEWWRTEPQRRLRELR